MFCVSVFMSGLRCYCVYGYLIAKSLFIFGYRCYDSSRIHRTNTYLEVNLSVDLQWERVKSVMFETVMYFWQNLAYQKSTLNSIFLEVVRVRMLDKIIIQQHYAVII